MIAARDGVLKEILGPQNLPATFLFLAVRSKEEKQKKTKWTLHSPTIARKCDISMFRVVGGCIARSFLEKKGL